MKIRQIWSIKQKTTEPLACADAGLALKCVVACHIARAVLL
jgi:hypothetical protein